MSDCGKYIELISLMVDGELNEEQEAELRTHMESCDECKRVFDAFAGISGALSEDLAEPPEMLAQSVMHKIGLKNHGMNKNRFYFSRFTAVAACFVIVMFGAFHFGLFDGMGSKTAMSAAEIPQATVTQNAEYSESADQAETYDAASPEPTNDEKAVAKGKSAVGAEPNPEPEAGGTDTSSAVPETRRQLLTGGTPGSGSNDNEVYQYGFATPKMAMITDENGTDSSTDSNKEPSSLFEATELTLYGGRYNSEESDKNNLLVTVSDKDKISSITELLAAVSADEVDYTNADTTFADEDPSYTVFVPADKASDDSAADETLGVWFVKGETWCVLEDASAKESGSESAKILYKAVGLQEKLENQIKQLELSK